MRWRKLIMPLALAGATAFTSQPVPATQAQVGTCTFTLGFQTLRDMIPEVVGDCIENEWHNPDNGDGLQRTTRGMLVWRKIDNWTAFTDGYMTWINGPFGLQSRLNTQLFAWEPVAPVPAPPQTATSPADSGGGTAAGGAVGGGTTTGTTTTTADEAPDVDLRISEEDVQTGQSFTIRIEARDDDGVDAIWWWASDTDDGDLRNTHVFECQGASPCRQTWTVSTNDTGDIRFHAVARDRDGGTSDGNTEEIEVRRPAATPTPTTAPAPAASPTTTP